MKDINSADLIIINLNLIYLFNHFSMTFKIYTLQIRIRMLPPKHPNSPRNIPHYHTSTVISNHQNAINNHCSSTSLDSRSRVSKYEHIRTPQAKRKALGRRKYINQLAYLDYEDKYIQIHTKYTMVSKQTALKKIKAKNQMAQFIDEEQQIQLGFEELMDFKYGKHGTEEQFHFEKNELTKQYEFCPQCDSIHNDHPQVHQKICRYKLLSQQQYSRQSNFYVYYSLNRIDSALKRTSGQEYDEIKEIVRKLIKVEENQLESSQSKLQIQGVQLERTLRTMSELAKVNADDSVFRSIVAKIFKLYNKRL